MGRLRRTAPVSTTSKAVADGLFVSRSELSVDNIVASAAMAATESTAAGPGFAKSTAGLSLAESAAGAETARACASPDRFARTSLMYFLLDYDEHSAQIVHQGLE